MIVSAVESRSIIDNRDTSRGGCSSSSTASDASAIVGGEAGGLEGDLIEIDCSAARTALLLSSTIESNAVLSNAELLPLLLPMLIARTETTGSLNAIRI